MFSLKNAGSLDEMPDSFSKAEFKQIFEIAKISNFNSEKLMDYERRMKYYSDYVNSLEYAEEKGLIRAAKSMLKEGDSVARVARITGLPKEQIMALK